MHKILIVDDSATMRKMVRSSLQSISQAYFEEAGSGLEAIEKLALSKPDVMFLDVNMPDMHGLELLRFVRSSEVYRSIAVVMLTTRGDSALREECLMLGAVRYMTKPFNPADLLSTATFLLQQAPV